MSKSRQHKPQLSRNRGRHSHMARPVEAVLRAARQSTSAAQLYGVLTEDTVFTPGQKVYVVGGMGMTNVRGTFSRIAPGGYAIIKDQDGKERTVMPHTLHPLHPGRFT
jgi:hypothetical protein